MQRLCATSMVVAVIIASTAGAAATARADASPAGALSQLPGQAACLATTNSDAPPDAGCTLLRTSATSRSCSNCLGNAVISPGTVIGRRCIVYPCANFSGILPENSILKVRQTHEVEMRR